VAQSLRPEPRSSLGSISGVGVVMGRWMTWRLSNCGCPTVALPCGGSDWGAHIGESLGVPCRSVWSRASDTSVWIQQRSGVGRLMTRHWLRGPWQCVSMPGFQAGSSPPLAAGDPGAPPGGAGLLALVLSETQSGGGRDTAGVACVREPGRRTCTPVVSPSKRARCGAIGSTGKAGPEPASHF